MLDSLQTGLAVTSTPLAFFDLKAQLKDCAKALGAPFGDHVQVFDEELRAVVSTDRGIQKRLTFVEGEPLAAARSLLLQDLFVLLVGLRADGRVRYDARTRTVFCGVARCLGLPEGLVHAWARDAGHRVSIVVAGQAGRQAPGDRKEATKDRLKKGAVIGAVAVTAGAAVAISGGLALPAIGMASTAIGAGVTGVGLAGAGAFVTTTGAAFTASAGTAMFLMGAGGASLTSWKLKRRWHGIREFGFETVEFTGPAASRPTTGSMDITICVPGTLPEEGGSCASMWARSGEAFPLAFADTYALRWETKLLRTLGAVMCNFAARQLAFQGPGVGMHATVALSGAAGAGAAAGVVALPAGLTAYLANLDQPWMCAKLRAKEAGQLLADAVVKMRAEGSRPVSLVGYSFGARLIFYALQSLYARGEFHCINNAVLLGAPVSTCFTKDAGAKMQIGAQRKLKWQRARAVIAGRFVTGYSNTDLALQFMYRYVEWDLQAAGLNPVHLPGVESVDLSGIVSNSSDYALQLQSILSRISESREEVGASGG